MISHPSDMSRLSALVLAEQLGLPLFTASDEVSSNRIEIHRPW
ncbi:MAG: hypothetical protein OXG55_14995 [bacterium]|nr:hypothetical protein [bacterium]MCY4104544.1 hypothetical protein [bacterium]